MFNYAVLTVNKVSVVLSLSEVKQTGRSQRNLIIVKGAQSRLNGLKSLAKLFNFVVFHSVSIFSIVSHPCSFILCYNLFSVFLSL